MADFTVETHSDWIVLANTAGVRDGVRLSFTPTEAEQVAFELLAAAARVRSSHVETTLTALRRDQQQIVASLQEVARKVARHDQSIGYILCDGVSLAPGFAMEMRDLPDPVTGQIRPVECVVRVDGAVAW